MNQDVRDLRNAGLYVFALTALASALVIGGGFMGNRVASSSTLQSIASIFDSDGDHSKTRVSVVVANAREIRAALDKPMPPRQAVPPVTAKLAIGALRPGSRVAATTQPNTQPKVPKLSAAAMDAMASADTRQRFSSAPPPELHKVY
jgi:hypothetical protein